LILYNVQGYERAQLFDLHKDPYEKNDLSANERFKPKLQELKSKLIREMHDTHDNLDLEKKNWGRE
jgi:hypothetical protein